MGTVSRDTLIASLQRFGIERDRMRTCLARRVGISESDLDALEHLEADGPLTQRDLAERLSLTSGAVTMLVDRLERVGWARRQPHPTDRRYTLIELTQKAAVDTPESISRYHAAISTLTARVPAQERETIVAFLAGAARAASKAAASLSQ